MSTLAPPRPAPPGRATASTGLRGPARLVVRQHLRAFQLLILLTVLAVAGLVAVALWVGHDAAAFARTGCQVGSNTPTHACAQSVGDYLGSQQHLRTARSWVELLLVLLPAVYGAFMAGPAIGRELESGTHRLAWTQSVSPARWLTAKLAVPTAAAVAATLVLTGITAWAAGQSEEYNEGWYFDGVRSASRCSPRLRPLRPGRRHLHRPAAAAHPRVHRRHRGRPRHRGLRAQPGTGPPLADGDGHLRDVRELRLPRGPLGDRLGLPHEHR